MDPLSSGIPIYVVKTGVVEHLPRITRSDDEWRTILTPESYEVARLQGTEFAFSGAYYANKEPGLYTCVCCGTDLFSSDDKFDSGTGWPSFSRPVSDLNVITIDDRNHGMQRTEVRCVRCGAHLGHVFDDGPAPSGLRYCMNSLSLTFIPG
ncbi:MAG: peptide-methionine (R)-S-oxide reductase [Methanomicrobiales archaeon HGW-Methanomicrobiales-4]|nr:MAG: peptide-methionine (R)-S-oxide reductase [Methanomicrobiales archaeon HGW-Methanomicrobiales-4]